MDLFWYQSLRDLRKASSCCELYSLFQIDWLIDWWICLVTFRSVPTIGSVLAELSRQAFVFASNQSIERSYVARYYRMKYPGPFLTEVIFRCILTLEFLLITPLKFNFYSVKFIGLLKSGRGGVVGMNILRSLTSAVLRPSRCAVSPSFPSFTIPARTVTQKPLSQRPDLQALAAKKAANKLQAVVAFIPYKDRPRAPNTKKNIRKRFNPAPSPVVDWTKTVDWYVEFLSPNHFSVHLRVKSRHIRDLNRILGVEIAMTVSNGTMRLIDWFKAV